MKLPIFYLKLLIVLLISFTFFSKTFAQSNLPAKSYWIVKDDYGRQVNTGVVKERYNEDSHGNIHGRYLGYDKTGNRIILANFNHGKLHGEYDGTMGFIIKSYERLKRESFMYAPDGISFDKVFFKTSIDEKTGFYGPSEMSYTINLLVNFRFVQTGEYKNMDKVGFWKECINNECWSGNYLEDKKEGVWSFNKSKGDDSEILKDYKVVKRVYHQGVLVKEYDVDGNDLVELKEMEKERSRYNKAVEIATIDAYDEFLHSNGDSQYAADIRERQEQLVYLKNNGAEAYLQKYASGHFKNEATNTFAAEKRAAENEELRSLIRRNDQAGLLKFANQTQIQEFKQEALINYDKIDYEKIKNSSDYDELSSFYRKSKSNFYNEKVATRAYELTGDFYSIELLTKTLNTFRRHLTSTQIEKLESKKIKIAELDLRIASFKKAKQDPSLLKSLIVPGWGNVEPNKVLRQESNVGMTVLFSYGSAGLGLACFSLANNTHNKYLESSNPEEWDQLLEDSNLYKSLGYGLIGLGASVYLGDLINVIGKKSRVRKEYNSMLRKKRQGSYVIVVPNFQTNGLYNTPHLQDHRVVFLS